MLQHERHHLMLEWLKEHNIATVLELARGLQVSDMTIRRDLKQLEEKGLLVRTHGGAVSLADTLNDKLSNRSAEAIGEKNRIAQAAAALVLDGATIYLGTGTTVACLAAALADRKNLTIVTSSILVLNELVNNPAIMLVLIGGMFMRDTGCFIGESSEIQLAKYRFQTAFVSASGVSPSDGVCIGLPVIASLEKVALQSANSAVLLADRRKIGRNALVKIAELADFQYLVTDLAAEDQLSAECAKKSRLINVTG